MFYQGFEKVAKDGKYSKKHVAAAGAAGAAAGAGAMYGAGKYMKHKKQLNSVMGKAKSYLSKLRGK